MVAFLYTTVGLRNLPPKKTYPIVQWQIWWTTRSVDPCWLLSALESKGMRLGFTHETGLREELNSNSSTGPAECE